MTSSPSREVCIATFCRTIRDRSHEHQRAMEALAGIYAYGITVGILRQELDSMIRVIYLLNQNIDEQLRLLTLSLRGEKWSIATDNGKFRKITDRDMVEIAENLHGWSGNVYRFGCSFIHLSPAHDYRTTDPLSHLPASDRDAIITHINHYHHAHLREGATLGDIAVYIPAILGKITQNLEHALQKLARGADAAP